MCRPANHEELYNLRHASARNIVEQIFGVVKNRWKILTIAPQFPMNIQVQIPPALAALHNFIMKYDPQDVQEYLGDSDSDSNLNPNPGQPHESEFGDLADGAVTQAEKNHATAARDALAKAMWRQYQSTLLECAN